jgi:prepilin-type N-terminal cleavage/methylation domain-containing protein
MHKFFNTRINKFNKSEKGFTIVELLVVIAIIAVLTAIALPFFFDNTAKAAQATVKSDVKNTVTAITAALIEDSTLGTEALQAEAVITGDNIITVGGSGYAFTVTGSSTDPRLSDWAYSYVNGVYSETEGNGDDGGDNGNGEVLPNENLIIALTANITEFDPPPSSGYCFSWDFGAIDIPEEECYNSGGEWVTGECYISGQPDPWIINEEECMSPWNGGEWVPFPTENEGPEKFTLTLPLYDFTSITVDWGNGTTETLTGDYPTFDYTVQGEYDIIVEGNMAKLGAAVESQLNNSQVFTAVTDWNNISSTSNAFNSWTHNFTVPDYLPSTVTDTSLMFYNASSFNQPLNNWDTSNVTNMYRMFFGASSFNQPLNNWDTSNMTNMSQMFFGASSFNQPLNNWDTSNMTNMSGMFYNASSFNQPLNNWDTSNVTNISNMFRNASSFNQPLNDWDTSNVTNMSGIFLSASSFNQPLNDWNTNSVENMISMFSSASSFNQPLNNWNTEKVTNMASMFSRASAFNQPLNNWNVSNVTNMSYMFQDASSFNQDISNWNVSTVTDMSYMFSGATSFNQPLNNWDTSSVTTMFGIFYGATYFNQPLNNWNVSNTNQFFGMRWMFRDATSFNQNLSGWNVSHISTKPDQFDTGATAWNEPKPIWGTNGGQ